MITPRPLDHLVIAVRDLDAAAAFYRALGFQVGVRNRHPWGTLNHIVQFDGSFLELIAMGEATDDRIAFVQLLRTCLGRGQGLAMLALASHDVARDHRLFAELGICQGDIFEFNRMGTLPDGRMAKVGFKLVFARSVLMLEAGFFTLQQSYPENFWNPSLQVHANGAMAIKGVMMVAENPAAHAEFLSQFIGERAMLSTSMGLEIESGRGRIDVLTALGFTFLTGIVPSEMSPHFAATRIGLRDLGALQTRLTAAGIAFTHHNGTLVIPPAAAFGMALVFETLT